MQFRRLIEIILCLCVSSGAGGGYEDVQVTLVDCPGHASLIRTIIGGKCVYIQQKVLCMCQYRGSKAKQTHPGQAALWKMHTTFLLPLNTETMAFCTVEVTSHTQKNKK